MGPNKARLSHFIIYPAFMEALVTILLIFEADISSLFCGATGIGYGYDLSAYSGLMPALMALEGMCRFIQGMDVPAPSCA